MEVRLRPTGCAGQAGGCLSFGLLNLVMKSQNRQYPLMLTEDEMILRNGTRIAWRDFTRLKVTDILLNGAYQHTQYELWHPGGRIHFASHRIEDAEAVAGFVIAHLPPQAERS